MDDYEKILLNRYRFFADAYAKKNSCYLRNSSARKKLQYDSRLAEIIFGYHYAYNNDFLIDNKFIDINFNKLEFFDIFAHVKIVSSAASILNNIKNKNSSLSYFDDYKIINSYFVNSNIFLRKIFNGYKKNKENNILDRCFHPYIIKMMSYTDNDLLSQIRDESYKEEVELFVRSANSSRKRIIDSLKKCFVEHEKIFICRFDIIASANKYLNGNEIYLEDYRKNIDEFLKKCELFDFALIVNFPTAVFGGVIRKSFSPVGQIVLVSKKKVTANVKALKAFSAEKKTCEILDFVPAQHLAKGLIPAVDGVLEFTPATVQAFAWLAEFLTLERRFFAPRCQESGSIHCLVEVELKR